MICRKCNEIINDEPDNPALGKILCPPCHEQAKAEMKARLVDADNVGKESSPAEFEASNAYGLGFSNPGAFTGLGRTAGGGHRIVKKSEPMAG